jgi:hypothetical protein
MISANDQKRFNELKAQFGPDGHANELTLSQFANLSYARASSLADRLANYLESAEILEIRARAKKALKAPKTGKY